MSNLNDCIIIQLGPDLVFYLFISFLITSWLPTCNRNIYWGINQLANCIFYHIIFVGSLPSLICPIHACLHYLTKKDMFTMPIIAYQVWFVQYIEITVYKEGKYSILIGKHIYIRKVCRDHRVDFRWVRTTDGISTVQGNQGSNWQHLHLLDLCLADLLVYLL
jgi:hypothetical protein